MVKSKKIIPCSDVYLITNDVFRFLDQGKEIKAIGIIIEFSDSNITNGLYSYICCDNKGVIYECYQADVEEVFYTYNDYKNRIRVLKSLLKVPIN